MAFYFNCSSLDLSFSQFIREYTSKVDELVKDKIDTQKEVKAKEQEEKELVAKQVLLSFCIIDGLYHIVVVSNKCIICLQNSLVFSSISDISCPHFIYITCNRVLLFSNTHTLFKHTQIDKVTYTSGLLSYFLPKQLCML